MKYLLVLSVAIAITAIVSTSGFCAAAAPNGAALYTSSCSCHGPLASSQKAGASAAMITGAISGNTGGMGMLKGLSAADIQAISAALGGGGTAPSAGPGTPAPSPAPSPAPAPGPSAGGAPSGTPAPQPATGGGGGGPSMGGPSGNAPEGMSGNCSACHPNGVPGSGKAAQGGKGGGGGKKSGAGSRGGEGRKTGGQATGGGEAEGADD